MLGTPELVHDYLIDYLTQPGVTLPPGMDLGLKAGGLAKGMMTKTISKSITTMAGNFIAGEDATTALPTLKKLWSEGVAFSVDLLGEACVSDRGGRGVSEAVSRSDRNAAAAKWPQWPANPILESDYLGPIPRTNVSIKISSLCARTDPIDFEGSLGALTDALAADPSSGGEEQRAHQFRHRAVRLQRPHAFAFRALLRGDRFPRRVGHAIVSEERRRRCRADHLLGEAQRAASDRPAHQGRVLGLRSDQRRADGLAGSRLARQTRDRRLFRADGRAVRLVDAAHGRPRRREARARVAQHPFDRLHAGAAGKARPARDRRWKRKSFRAWAISFARPCSIAGCEFASTCPSDR